MAMAQGALVTTLIAFGSVNDGASSTNAFTLTNNGSGSATISQVSVSGTAFSVTGINTPYVLQPGGSVTLSVTFAPTTATSYSGIVTITSDAGNSPLNIALSGTGAQPPEAQLSTTPANEGFGNVNVGSTATDTITLANNGNASAAINQVSVSGNGFSMSGLSAPYTLAAGATTSFQVTFSPNSAGTYNGSVSIASNVPNSPTVVPLSGTGVTPTSGSAPICGKVDDNLVHPPPNYDTFRPPSVGQSYVDPVYGCTVERLTNGSQESLWDGSHPALMNYYSTLSALNASDTMLFVISNDGGWTLRSTTGSIVTTYTPNWSGIPVWDASNGNVFYYATGNSIASGTVNGSSIIETVLHTFPEYSGVTQMDSADLSQDGDHVALVGQNSNGTMDVFVWSFSQKAKTSVYTTRCTGSVAGSSQPGCLHKLQLTADNRLGIEFVNDGTGAEQGLRLWNGSSLVHLQDHTSHYDTGYDLNGNSIFISQNNSYSLSGLNNNCPDGWGLDVRQLYNVMSSVCLIDYQPYWHVSYRGSLSQPWIALTFFDTRTPGPEYFSTDPNYQTISTSNWQLYEDEVMVAKVDASKIYRLAHARSRSVESYWAQPRGTISRDGKYIVFTSNMAYPNGCPANMHVANDCEDVYMIKIQ